MYKEQFEKLIEAGVPKSFIRDELLTEVIYFSETHVYRHPERGWYSIAAVGISSPPAGVKRYGSLKSAGFPTWDEYKLLFNGDEWDSQSAFIADYEAHRRDWLIENLQNRGGQ